MALAFLRDATRGLARVVEVRGRGLLLGIECDTTADARCALAPRRSRRGVIVMPSGDDGRVLAVTPPL